MIGAFRTGMGVTATDDRSRIVAGGKSGLMSTGGSTTGSFTGIVGVGKAAGRGIDAAGKDVGIDGTRVGSGKGLT